MQIEDRYNTSFRCFYNDGEGVHATTHYVPGFPVAAIPRWIDAYKFTHPNCDAISCKVWFANGVGYETPPDDEDQT